MTAPRRKTVGLALSGGSARGAAHLGVLQVLERGGIQIDVVSGVSAGSVVGALYCAGIPLDEMVRALKGFSWQHIAALTLSYHGLLSFAKLEQYLTRWIGDVWFSELKKPFAVGATDLLTGRPITFTAGRVAPLVRASCSIPGLVVPLEYGEYWLTDGGISCNLPSYAARQLGADLVIGVDLMKPYVRKNLGVAGIASTAVEIMIRHSGGGLVGADIVIAPALDNKRYSRFSRYLEMMELGAQAAEARLPAILAQLGTPPPAVQVVSPDGARGNGRSTPEESTAEV
jgi:NTE family protein